eukprot:6390975-Lingulodinium_polyedra.AAC.1
MVDVGNERRFCPSVATHQNPGLQEARAESARSFFWRCFLTGFLSAGERPRRPNVRAFSAERQFSRAPAFLVPSNYS